MTANIQLELPPGRSFEEYIQMFNLTAKDLARPMIGCGDGLSSFNTRMKELGYSVVSCDPIYRKSIPEIKSDMAANRGATIQTPRNRVEDNFWLYNNHNAVFDEFFADYEAGKREGRYLPYGLPRLPFADQAFEIALCSHFLFTHADLGQAFHAAAIREMLRVAKDARIFPLIDLQCRKPEFLEPVMAELRRQGYQAAIKKVDYGFYENGMEMMRVRL